VVGRQWRPKWVEEGVERGEGSTAGRMVQVEEHALWQVRIVQRFVEAVAAIPVLFFLLSFLNTLSNFYVHTDPLADNFAGITAAVVNEVVGLVLVLPHSVC
jgi:hypothetical protein